MDVFGGLSAGGASEDHIAAIESLLTGARLLGAELEPRYRVLAVTIEPAEGHPLTAARRDRRVQVLCHPVATILASLRRTDDRDRELLAFDHEQLPDVVRTVAGAPLRSPVLGRPEPAPGAWGPRFSMEGRSIASDGVMRTITIEVADGDLTFSLFARFDEIDVHDPQGERLDPLAS